MSPKVQKATSLMIGAVGLALLAMMITIEGEFGALPLALLAIAAAIRVWAWIRERRTF